MLEDGLPDLTFLDRWLFSDPLDIKNRSKNVKAAMIRSVRLVS
jgi:hypothetical protein